MSGRVSRSGRSVRLLVCAAGVMSAGGKAFASPPSGSNWGLTFADEFNNNSLDTMKWLDGYPWSGGNANNNVLTSNATVTTTNGNGVLNLIQTRLSSAQTVDGNSLAAGAFTGSAVSTRLVDTGNATGKNVDMFDFTNGYVEASIDLPTHAGSWPAFWMLQGGWPPEVDIMEDPIFTQSSGSAGTVGFNTAYHYTNSSGSNASAAGYVNTTAAESGFHTFGLLWTTNSLAFYLDGKQIQSASGLSAAQIQQAEKMYILFTNGGGSWAGTPSQSEWANGVSDQMQVNWVRVWQAAPTTTTDTWTKSGSGTWTTASAWSVGAAPSQSTQTAVFGSAGSSNVAITWNYSQTVGGLTFNSATPYTLGSLTGTANGLMLATGNSGSVAGGTSLIDSSASTGADTINCRLELYNNLQIKASTSTPLTINGQIIGSFSTSGLQIASGSVVLGGANTYTGTTSVLNGSTLKLAVTGSLASNLIDVAAGTLDVSAKAFTLGSTQTLRGDGSVLGAMTVAGTLEPGEGVGALDTGDLTLGTGSHLLIDIAGAAAGDNGVLDSSGSVVLQSGSELDVAFINGFVPAVSDVFDVMDFSRLSGTFGTLNLPALPSSETWNTSQLYTQGVLSVAAVPEPATLGFLSLVPVGLCARGRRRIARLR